MKQFNYFEQFGIKWKHFVEYLLHARFVDGQLAEGIHKFDEPLSKTTIKVCGGVPIEIGP